MTRHLLILPLCAVLGAALPALAQGERPEGRYLQEVLREEDPLVLRYRFVMPELDRLTPEAVLTEMERICTEEIVPYLDAENRAATIVVSFAEAETVFGEHDPEIRQQFDSYRVEEDRCIWKMF